jgi:hypothetical protein
MMRVLKFLRIVDAGKPLEVSITNVACWVVIIKIAIAQQASMADLGAMLVSLANYAHKRHLNSKDDE